MDALDDLEDDLFGTLLRRKNSSAGPKISKSNTQATSGIKKKVVFHDFNEDDPLGDLLSEEEDSQPNTGANIKGSIMSDLFGIKGNDALESNTHQNKSQPKLISSVDNVVAAADKLSAKSGDQSGPSISTEITQEIRKAIPLPRSNILTNNAVATSTTDRSGKAGDKSKKSYLMEDLFGNRAKDKVPLKDTTVAGLDISEIQKKSEQLSKPNSIGYAPTLSAPRESRRSRRSSGGIIDPLGMFSSPTLASETSTVQNTEVTASKLDYPSSSGLKDARTIVGESVKSNPELPSDDLPEWLGGSKKFSKNVTPAITKSGDKTLNTAHALDTSRDQGVENPEDLPAQSSLDHLQNYPGHLSLMTGIQFDQQATMLSLQQQEHELRTAVTLSRQSEQLNKMIESQRGRLNDQEKQFSLLIKRQIDRQELLEAQMKAQQDRINSHLQALLAQPISVPFMPPTIQNNDLNKGSDENKKDQNTLEVIIRKLETEKLDFENIIDKLKDQHSKEIRIIEESYMRQIEIMNQGSVRLEKRLRQDVESAEADYGAKIQKMKEEQESLKIAHGEELENLKMEHIKQIQEIRNQQHRNIQLVQNEYIETIQNISKAKEIEQQTINSATIQTATLSDTLEVMKNTISEIEELKIKLENSMDESNKAKEYILKQHIDEIKDLKEHLKKQHEALEVDRKDLAEALRHLDGGTVRLISEFDRHTEENLEAENRLKSREETLIRDRELLDQHIQWERNHIQVMKETWIREQERQIKQLSEERNSIATERARLETIQRLKFDNDDVTKAELEATLCTARDATNLANRERQKWRERLNELQIEKQKIKEKENALTLRARELEDLTQSALEKREEGLRALKEAHHLDEQHKAYFGQLQMQSEALAQRENKLAAEKLALARYIRILGLEKIERLALRMNQPEKPEKDTGGSEFHTEQHSQYALQFNNFHDSQIITTHFKDIVDPRLVLLKLGLDNELDVTDDCLGTV
ncbi:putative leucine-rich repeat-containing protein DDB_G0290503 isoform X1 [Neodiprion pinetum]|uniref:putative leucine-rich repeat-containing protein DDB_G0290503 isoform X1 n=1 Tax=Neodiprion pinetum TaxID=441929 RepID=UPI001EDCFFDC|nr:myosin-7 isoform X1 [Neodiprion pinetum]XP_046470673.1 myosin-7 isoform X1 [Neodiprion pinetum]